MDKNQKSILLSDIVKNMCTYNDIFLSHVKANQKIKKTFYNQFLTHLRTFREILNFFSKNNETLESIKELKSIMEKINNDFEQSDYQNKKEIKVEEDLKKNLHYLTYHL